MTEVNLDPGKERERERKMRHGAGGSVRERSEKRYERMS